MFDLILKPGRERSLVRRHPWVFSGAFRPVEQEIAPGSTVRVLDAKGNVLGMGAYSPESRLSVRMWSFKEQEIGKEFFFTMKLDEDYEDAALAGKTVKFTVNVKKALPAVYPDRPSQIEPTTDPPS